MIGQFCSRRASAVMVSCLLATLAPTTVAADFDAAAVFTTRCATCHTIGKGDLIGPDLAGVTDRRERPWLIAFVRSSQSVVLSGDPTANELFDRFGGTKMPDHPYGDEEIDNLLTLIENGGPAPRISFRHASTATAEEIAAGRDLFFGRSALDVTCASCHTIGQGSVEDSLYLGGSLTHVASRYQDRELHTRLAQLGTTCRSPLPSEESFLVRAFLRDVEESGGEGGPPTGTFPLLAGSVGLLLIAVGRDRNGREPSA